MQRSNDGRNGLSDAELDEMTGEATVDAHDESEHP